MVQQHMNIMVRQARAFLDAAQPGEARRLLEEARMLARDDLEARAEILVLLAQACAMSGRGSDAVLHVRQALECSPTTDVPFEQLAENCERAGQPEDAATLRAMDQKAGRAAPPRRRSRRFALTTILLVLSLAIAALIYYVAWPNQGSGAASGRPGRLDFQRVKDNVGLVVVTARYTYLDGQSVTWPIGMGSCFAVSQDGYLLTNRHVTDARNKAPETMVDGDSLTAKRDWWKIKVCFGADERRHYDAQLVYESPYRDVALLKIDRRFPSCFHLARDWAPGDDVYAAGFPAEVAEALMEKNASQIIRNAVAELKKPDADVSTLPLPESAYEVTVTRGMISAIRKIDDQAHVQTDAVINPGNSGGPLLTTPCDVVGINTMATAKSEAYNFALSLNEVVAELRPFLTLE